MEGNRQIRDIRPLVLVLAIFIIAIVIFWDLLGAIVMSLTVAVVAMPLRMRLDRKLNKSLSALVTTLMVLSIVLLLILFTLGLLYQNLDYLVGATAGITEGVRDFRIEEINFIPFIPAEAVADWISEGAAQGLGYLVEHILEVPALLLQLTIFTLSLFLFILKGDRIYSEIWKRMSPRVRSALQKISARAADTLYAVYIVEGIVAVITFFIAIPFFFLLGYERVLFLSFITGIFQLVPILGPSFIMVFFAALALLDGDITRAVLLLLVGYPVVAAFPDAYIRPLLMGKRSGIHPVIMWIGIFGGLHVLGIIGFVIGPLVLALAVSGYQVLLEELKPVHEEIGE
jgi:predicted PurR-regulated permease PerM